MTTTISMANTTGGLDVPTLITSLMKAESIPLNTLQTQQAGIKSEISSYGHLLSLNSTLDDNLNTLKSASTMSQSGLADAVKSFIDSYNAMQAGVSSETGYKATLQGHFDAFNYGHALSSTLFREPGVGSINALMDMGIKLNNDGTLGFDSSKFNTAITNDAASVTSFVSNFATNLENVTNPYLGTASMFKSDQTLLQSRYDSLDKRATAMQTLLDKKQALYQSQFDAMQKALSNINGNGGAATSILSNMATAMANGK